MQTFTRVYDNYSQAQQAVRDLLEVGVPNSDISVIANKYVSEQYDDVDDVSATTTGAGTGAAVGGGAGLLAGIGLLAIPGLGPVVAAGWFAATAAGALAGGVAGGIIGALVDYGTSEEDAHVYSEAVRRGGTMITVRTDEKSDRVLAALDKHAPINAAARRKEYVDGGWKTFDPKAPPYRPNDAEIERIRRNHY